MTGNSENERSFPWSSKLFESDFLVLNAELARRGKISF